MLHGNPDKNNISMEDSDFVGERKVLKDNKDNADIEHEKDKEIETTLVETDDMQIEVPKNVVVKSTIAAATQSPKHPTNLKKAVMNREPYLQEITGTKSTVFDNLRAKYMGMSGNVKQALRHFIIFPNSFDLTAATAVAGLDESHVTLMQGMLDTMIQTEFIMISKGRFELKEAVRLFLSEEESVVKDHVLHNTYQVAQKRFILHYQKQLSQLQDDNIHQMGWIREQAMTLFDSERENIEFAEYLLSGRTYDLRRFLLAGITVMRYCVSASYREILLKKVLEGYGSSTKDTFLSFNQQQQQQQAEEQQISEQENPKSKEEAEEEDRAQLARLYLALSEAYFDQLKLNEAEPPLLQALVLMEHSQSYREPETLTSTSNSNPTGITSPSSPSSGSISSKIYCNAVLTLLLLSTLRMTSKRVKEARVLCVRALRILAEAHLGKSTYAINAMSNLVSMYLSEGQLQKAKSVSDKILDTLNTMGFTGMPIHADVLGVCAMVSMAERNHEKAEIQYRRALETVDKWGSKNWTEIPVKHCLDLDILLKEGLAESIRKQGKVQGAILLEQQAAEDRRHRGLPHQSTPTPLISDLAEGIDNGNKNNKSVPLLRHLY